MSETVLIEGACIVTMDENQRVIPSGDILIRDGRIEAVGTVAVTQTTPSRRLDANGKIAFPGLINAHSHSPLANVQGTYDRLNHRAAMWLFQAHTKNRTPEEIRLSTLKNATEMLLSGTTSVIDHFPEQAFTIEDVEAVVEAYSESGMRAVVALRIFDGKYADIFPPSGSFADDLLEDLRANNPLEPPPLAETREVCIEAIRRFDGAANGRIRVCPAPSNPIRCSDDLLRMCVELAGDYGVGIHCHLLETAVQTTIAQRRYGKTIVQHLDDLGLLSPDLSCAHTVWIEDEDIDLMAERGAVVVHNPESNTRGGSGIAPTTKMLAKGVPVAIGNDGSCSGGQQILQRAMRLATLIHREPGTIPQSWISNQDALAMGTLHGAAAMRMKGELGAIAPGYKADLALYDLDHPWWIPLRNPAGQFVASETGRSLDTVIIDGRVVVENATIATYDSATVIGDLRAATPVMRARNANLFDLAQRLSQAALM